MGRSRSSSKAKHGRKKEKSKKAKSSRHDDSDHSSVIYESSSDGEYDDPGRWSDKKKGKADEWTSDDDRSVYSSDIDGSYRPKKRSHSKNDGYISDDRSKFSARIDQIRRGHDDYSVNSDTGSESDSRSSRSSSVSRDYNEKLRGSGSNSNHRPQSQRSLSSSRQPSTRSMNNSSFHSQEQQQMSIPQMNNRQAMLSTSVRSMGSAGPSFFPGQQYPASGALLNQGRGQNQQMNLASGQNIQGQKNPRFPPGPGHMMRSMSGRSINSFSSGQMQSRSSQSGNMASPLTASPTMLSQRGLGVIGGAYSGNVLPSPSVYVQQQGMMNMSSRSNIIGNNEPPINSQMNRQSPGLMRVGSNRSLGNGMHPQRPEMIRMASQNSLGNNNALLNSNPMVSQRHGLVRNSSQRSLGNNQALLNIATIHSNPNVRMDMTGQSIARTKNSYGAEIRTEPSSITGDAVSTTPATLDNISPESSNSRRSAPPESLADIIYSRSRNQHGDTQSMGTAYDPPGEEFNRFRRKVDELFSDDSSYDSYRDNQKSYVNDPPDKFDDDRSCINASGDESEPRQEDDDSFRSMDDRHNFYEEDESHSSYIDEGYEETNNARVSKKASGNDTSSSSFKGKKNGKRKGKSRSTFATDDPPENEHSFRSERDVDSCNVHKDPKNQNDNIATPAQQASISWLAKQISVRKGKDATTGSRNLEPEGTSINRTDSLSRKVKGRDADGCGGSSICDRIKDGDESMRSANDSILRRKIRDAGMPSVKLGTLRSDDSTTTTDTMTQEVPLVIVGVKDDIQGLCTDSYSVLSTSDDESTPQRRAPCKGEKKKRSHLPLDAGKRKSVSKRLTRKKSAEKGRRGKESRNKQNPRNDDITSKVKNCTKQDPLGEEGSKQKKPSQKKKVVKEKRTTTKDWASSGRALDRTENSSERKTPRKGNKSSSRSSGMRRANIESDLKEFDDVQSFEDQQSVMTLIDQLKSFELQRV
mmetsp:Transcript_14091/g.35405  ORF Transcript_14091/g.35405 Transcript_14091/m.35405 type:complete len:979 (-) Transcript_14091:133-3069(-)